MIRYTDTVRRCIHVGYNCASRYINKLPIRRRWGDALHNRATILFDTLRVSANSVITNS